MDLQEIWIYTKRDHLGLRPLPGITYWSMKVHLMDWDNLNSCRLILLAQSAQRGISGVSTNVTSVYKCKFLL